MARPNGLIEIIKITDDVSTCDLYLNQSLIAVRFLPGT